MERWGLLPISKMPQPGVAAAGTEGAGWQHNEPMGLCSPDPVMETSGRLTDTAALQRGNIAWFHHQQTRQKLWSFRKGQHSLMITIHWLASISYSIAPSI